MKENFKMWSPNSIGLEGVDIVLDHQRTLQAAPKFEPNPYTFTKIENGKKTTADSSSLNPPSWLLLDHTIAVVWSMFSFSPTLQQLSIDDLKWAYEFLKRIKNKKGENPPDVKVCLKEIQDRLINLYANLSSLKEEDFDEIAAAFGEKIIQDSTTSYVNSSFLTSTKKIEPVSLSSSKTDLRLVSRQSTRDITSSENGKRGANNPRQSVPTVEEDSGIYDGTETGEEEEEVEYLLSLFDGEKKQEHLQARSSSKSLIPTKKKTQPSGLSEVLSSQDTRELKKEKQTKRVQCFAEMRSLKFQKSMKVKDTNGDEAAYSNLKAEIQRLTFNPNVSKAEVMKFLKDWRSEQVDRLHNELKRLSSIEDEFLMGKHGKYKFMRTLNSEDVGPNIRVNSHGLKELEPEKYNYSWGKSLYP